MVKGVNMIKVDVCALKPVVRQVGKRVGVVAKTAAIAIPAMVGKEIFESEARKQEGNKRNPSSCSDYCCEPL